MEKTMKDLIDINEVCEVAKISKPTIYRRVKNGTFPKPVKIKSHKTRGPKQVNRWKRGEVVGWIINGNKNPQSCTAKKTKPDLYTLFMDDAARNAEGAGLEDIYNADTPKITLWQKWKYPIMAMCAGAIAGILTELI
jgi:predicted DNA-binding transcriptional regulator AlpA